MKTQKGFGMPLIIGILALLIFGGIIYYNESKQTNIDTPNQEEKEDDVTKKDSTTTSEISDNYEDECLPPDCVSDRHNRPTDFEKFADMHNRFGIDLIKTIWQTDKGKNIFISPTSIALALSMVYVGANGETETAMQKTLNFQNLKNYEVENASIDLINKLKSPDPKVELSIANSVWAKKDVKFKKEFLKTLEYYFKAKSSVLDFNNPDSINTINTWISQNTNGKIPTIIDNIPSNIVMYLINAVYFKGSWTDEFDKKLTENRPFAIAPGYTPNSIPMMKKTDIFSYLENADFQSVKLDYGKYKKISMYVFLPTVSTDRFVNDLTATKLNSWISMYGAKEGTLILPKFKIEYEKQLKDALTDLGMGIAFEDNADLSDIGENLKISEVKHKTFVEVNEEGTEAAAVTNIAIAPTAIMLPSGKFYMEVNRPFFFIIRDNITGEILFMGAIQNP